MIDWSTFRKGWSLLDARGKRNALKVLTVMTFAAFASAVMVGSIFPFLSVLSDPSLIQTTPILSWAYATGRFTSVYSFLVALGVLSIVVIILSNLVLVLNTWVLARFSWMRVHSIGRMLMAHYLAQPYEYFLDRHSGDMSTNILSESHLVVSQFLRPAAELISASLTVTAVVVTLLLVDPIVVAATIATFVALYSAVVILTRRFVKSIGKRRAEANEARFRIAGEAFGGIKDVKLLGREQGYLDRYSIPSVEMARSEIGLGVISQAPRYAIQIVAFGGLIVLCLVLLDPAVIERREALGDVLPLMGLFAFAGQRLLPELQKIYTSLTQIAYGEAAVDRVWADLHQGAQRDGFSGEKSVPLGLSGVLQLEGVSYSYPAAEHPGIEDVSLAIRKGERIGVVGSSGAGKTTLADVILGLLPAASGEMSVDGVLIDAGNLRAWQRSVGYVPQDIFLTDGSLSDNIAFGLPPEEIDGRRVEHAARIAQLHQFVVTELPEGYSTTIGERGVRLSGGQRQRIGIARALYHDADLIVFDEATSALDNLTEREVMAAIEALPGDKTILMIAHRLSTVKVCDRIVVMEAGRVADIGTWEELVSRNAAFRALADAA